MKSIIEEASSVSKAVENGWIRAGKPTQFSVKIFELPEKNFFGLTVKKAKVGILFETEVSTTSHHKNSAGKRGSANHPKKQVSERSHNTSSSSAQQPFSQKSSSSEQPRREQRAPQKPQKTTAQQPEPEQKRAERVEAEKPQEKFPPLNWTPEVVLFVDTMIHESLALMGLPNIDFTTAPTEIGLKVTFDAPIIDNPLKERQFFQSYAHVIVAAVRNQFKPESRSIRLTLVSTRS